MRNMIKNIRRIYKKIIPDSLRDTSFLIKVENLLIPHNWIYNSDYYEDIEGFASHSAPIIAKTIYKVFEPNNVIDVGCGTGVLLDELRSNGCKVYGLEYSGAALKYCANRGLNVSKFNIEKDSLTKNVIYDVVISMEVAEHLPASIADKYVGLLTGLAKEAIVFTAARPGQGGTNHVNEQPSKYWIKKFKLNGFEYSEDLTHHWKKEWEEADIEPWYFKNILIFEA